MKIRTAVVVAALAVAGVPAGALSAKPAHPTHPTTPATTNASKSTVMFVLHGCSRPLLRSHTLCPLRGDSMRRDGLPDPGRGNFGQKHRRADAERHRQQHGNG